ncbi:restriction endonuclease subunit S [Legionella pneumophila serogroup 1]
MMAVRFKTFMKERIDLSDTGEETLLSVSEYYGVKPRKDAFSEESFESRAANLEGYRRVFQGDFVMNYMLAWKGAYGISNYEGIVSPAYAVFEIDKKKACLSYIHHCLRSEYFKGYFKSHSKGIIESRLRLYPDTFLSLPIELPSYEIQKEIGDFLDLETDRINQLIENKKKLICLMKERESNAVREAIFSLINEGVQIWKLSHICRVQRGKFTHRPRNAPELYDGEVPFIQTGDVARADKFITQHKQTLSELGMSVSAKFPSNTLLMAIAANVGNLAITTYEVYCPDSVVGFIPTEKVDSEYLYYVLRAISDDISSISTSNAQDNTNVARLGSLKIPLPSIQKQKILIDRFKIEEDLLFKMASKISNSISKLNEFRSALISEAVTGQLDIKSWKKRGSTDKHLDNIEEAMRT